MDVQNEYAVTNYPHDINGNLVCDLDVIMSVFTDADLEAAFEDLVDAQRTVLPNSYTLGPSSYQALAYDPAISLDELNAAEVYNFFGHKQSTCSFIEEPMGTVDVSAHAMRALLRALCNDMFTDNEPMTNLDLRATVGIINPGGMPYVVSGGRPRSFLPPTEGYDAIMLLDNLDVFDDPIETTLARINSDKED